MPKLSVSTSSIPYGKANSYLSLFDNFPEPTTVWDQNGILLTQTLISARNLGGSAKNSLARISRIFLAVRPTSIWKNYPVAQNQGVSETRGTMRIIFRQNAVSGPSIERILNPNSGLLLSRFGPMTSPTAKAQKSSCARPKKNLVPSFIFHPSAIAIVRADDEPLSGCEQSLHQALRWCLFPDAFEKFRMISFDGRILIPRIEIPGSHRTHGIVANFSTNGLPE